MGIVTQKITEFSNPVAPSRYNSCVRKTRTVQKPFSGPLVLPYELQKQVLVTNTLVGNDPYWYRTADQTWETQLAYDYAFRDFSYRNDLGRCYNIARAKCFERLKAGNADLLALLLERKAASRMIFDRLTQMADIADAVHQRNRKKIIRALRVNPSEFNRKFKKNSGLLSNPSATYLEISWGWLPLLSDLMSSVAYLGLAAPLGAYSGSSGISYSTSFHRDDPSGSYPVNNGDQTGKLRLKVGCTVSVESVLRSEIQRLGLTNPGASAWEVISYSWLADYFVNIGEIIEGWDDNLTLSYEQGYVTRLVKGVDTYNYVRRYRNPDRLEGCYAVRTNVMMNRQTYGSSLPSPVLVYNPSPFNLRRASYLASLLVLRLKQFKRFSNQVL